MSQTKNTKQKISQISILNSLISLVIGFILSLISLSPVISPSFFLIVGVLSLLLHMGLEVSIAKEQNTIYFAKVHPSAIIPSRDNENGCYDLYACIGESIIIPPHANKLIPTGIISAFDPKYRIAFRERGSNTKSNSIIMAGQIDSGYRGEYFVSVYNGNDIPIEITNSIKEVEKAEDFIRIPSSKALCQFAVEPVPHIKVKRVEEDQIFSIKSKRGSGKLGSSGK